MIMEKYTIALEFENNVIEYDIDLLGIIRQARLYFGHTYHINEELFTYIADNLDTLIFAEISIEYDITIDTEDLSIDSEDMLKCIADILEVEYN